MFRVMQIRYTDIVFSTYIAILQLCAAEMNFAQHCGSSPAGACIDCSLAGLGFSIFSCVASDGRVI